MPVELIADFPENETMNQTLRDSGTSKSSAESLAEIYQDERVAHLTRLCARGFNRALTRRLADYDISFGQWVFLRILWKQEGLTQRELSERANLTEPTVHTALAKMQQQGLVERRTEDGNRRKQHVYLTDHGRGLRSDLEPLAVEANEAALQGFAVEDNEALRQMLIRMLANLEQDEIKAAARGQKVPPTRGTNM